MLTCKAIVLLLCPGVPWAQNDPSILAAYESAQQWRAHYGLQRQALDERACIMAQRHAEQMARFEWFEHGAHDQIIQRGARTADNAVRSWVYSPPHLGWLLTGRRRCGFGHAVSSSGTHYWAGVFR